MRTVHCFVRPSPGSAESLRLIELSAPQGIRQGVTFHRRNRTKTYLSPSYASVSRLYRLVEDLSDMGRARIYVRAMFADGWLARVD